MTITTKKPAKAKVSQAKQSANELTEISTVKLVPLALIDTLPQIRTEFDEVSIAELAKDIEARGLLQPVLLNPNGDRYTLIAGERRLRAVTLLGMPGIPALITKASSKEAKLMQLAENIQREGLSLADEAAMVRELHDMLGTVKAVAEEVKKSSGWVSKRLAVTHTEFSHYARGLMEEGVTEDIELLNALDQVSRLDYWEAKQLAKEIRNGKADRNAAREILKKLKEKEESRKINENPEATAKRSNEMKERQKQHEAKMLERRRLEREGTGPEFIEWAMDELDTLVSTPGEGEEDPITWLSNELNQDQRDTLQNRLANIANEAKDATFTSWVQRLREWGNHELYIETLAAILGMKGEKIDNLYAFVETIAAENRNPEPEEIEDGEEA